MDAAALTPAQRYELLLAVAARRDWLAKLRARMDTAGWAQDDAVYVAGTPTTPRTGSYAP